MDKKIGLQVLILIMSLILGGCWDRREPENMLVVNSILFDRTGTENNSQYKVSFNASKPGTEETQAGTGGETGGQQGPGRWITTCHGNTVEEALSRLSSYSTRYPYLGHMRIIAFSEELVRGYLHETIDYLARKQNIRFRSYVVVTKGKDTLLSSEARYEETLSEELHSILELGSREGDSFHSNDLNHFIQDLLAEGKDPWAPVVKFAASADENEATTGTSVMVEGTALFKGEMLAGFLNAEETRGFLMLKGLARKDSISVSYDGKKASFRYHQVNVKREPVSEGGNIRIDYRVSCKGFLQEMTFGTSFSEEAMAGLEKTIAGRIEHNLTETIQKCQRLKSDALGIGRFIHATNPKFWSQYSHDWSEIFPEIEIGVKVDVEITGTDFGYRPVKPSE